MREYLDSEFRDIEPTLLFDYSLERIIDDFILLAVFVGNDFLPNLPDLHIHENGLERLFDVYKTVLPKLSEFFCPNLFLTFWLVGCWGHVIDGYINESGNINTTRLQVVLDEMTHWEQEVFEREYSDMNWYKSKQAKYVKEAEKQKSEWEDEASGDDDEAKAAADRVMKKYEKAPVVDLDAQGSFDERHERSVKEKMLEWKRGYYRVWCFFSALCLRSATDSFLW